MPRFSRKNRQWSSIRTRFAGLINAISFSNTGKGAPCVSNLGDRMSLRLVTKRGETVESLGNGLRLDQEIDVSARACGRIAIELQPKRHTLEEKHHTPRSRRWRSSLFHSAHCARAWVLSRKRRGEGALCLLLCARALRSVCATRGLGSGGAPPKAKPLASRTREPPWPLHRKPAAQSIHAPLVKGAFAARSPGADTRCKVSKFSGKLKRCNAHWNRFSHKARKRVLPWTRARFSS